MEQGKRPPIGELQVTADITFTSEQLHALMRFYGDIPVQDVIQSLSGMDEEGRTNFMSRLLARYEEANEPSPYDLDQ